MATFDSADRPTRSKPDREVPANLLQFMLQSSSQKTAKLPKALPNAKSFRARRERLSRHFPGELLVIPTGHPKVRANDTYYPFRPGTDFYYLTGTSSPIACC